MNVIDRLKAIDSKLVTVESRLGEVRRRVSEVEGGNGSGEGQGVTFYDAFEDADIYWPWAKHNESANKRITEANGVLRIEVDDGYNADWSAGNASAPLIATGCPGFPLMVEAKFNSWSTDDIKTDCGLMIMRTTAAGSSSFVHMSFYQSTLASADSGFGLGFHYASSATETSIDDPTGYYIRLALTAHGTMITNVARLWGWYSSDGVNWNLMGTGAYTNSGWSPSTGLSLGFYARNWSPNYGGIDVKFEYIKAWVDTGPGEGT